MIEYEEEEAGLCVMNPLCEKNWLEDDEEEIIEFNALHERYDEIMENPLFENDNCHCNLLPNGFVFLEVLKLVLEVRQNLVIQNPTKTFSYTGYQILDWLLQKTVSFPEFGIGAHLAFSVEEDAIALCQEFLNRHFMVSVPYIEEAIFSREGTYRFLEDEDPAFYKDIINVKPRHKISAGKSKSSTKSRRSSLHQRGKSLDLGNRKSVGGVDFNQVLNQLQQILDPNNSNSTALPSSLFSQEEIDAIIPYYQTPCVLPGFLLQMESIAKQIVQYVNYQQGFVDYFALSNSDVFKQWIQMSNQLRFLDLTWLESLDSPAVTISFYSNLINLMTIHALLARGCGHTKEARDTFFYQEFYFLQHKKISLHHLIEKIAKKDPRIFFVISFGYKSCPLPIALEQDQIDYILVNEAKSFLNAQLSITEAAIEFPFHLDMMYREVFECSFVKVLNFIIPFLSQEMKEKLNKVLSKFQWSQEKLQEQASLETHKEFPIKCTFQEADYDSQRQVTRKRRKSKTDIEEEEEEEEEEVKRITLEDVKRDLKLRSFFQKFCKLEYSEENVLFFDQVMEYRTLKDPYLMHEMLKMIYDEFLSPTAPREVNVTKSMITTIADLLADKNVMDKITPSVLDTLENEVEVVLVDSFSRFEVSELYYEMVQFAQKHKTSQKSSKLALLSKRQQQVRKSTVLLESPIKDADAYLSVTNAIFSDGAKKRQSVGNLFLELRSGGALL